MLIGLGVVLYPRAKPKPALLEFRHVTGIQNKCHPNARYRIRDGSTLVFIDEKGKMVEQERVLKQSKLIMSGMDVKPTAQVVEYQQVRMIAIEFTVSGTRKFADFTAKNVGEMLAIILNGRILAVPMVSGPVLDGRAVINGEFTNQEARELASLVNSAANQKEKPDLAVRLFRKYRDFTYRIIHR